MRALAATILAVAALAGCGDADDSAPRAALRGFLADLAHGDVAATCRSVTPAAVAELARDFGAGGCATTVSALARYVRAANGQRLAFERARVLAQSDIPLSPAPTREHARTTSLRVLLRDPVLNRRQRVDVTLRRRGGRWLVDAGVAALLTVLERPDV